VSADASVRLLLTSHLSGSKPIRLFLPGIKYPQRCEGGWLYYTAAYDMLKKKQKNSTTMCLVMHGERQQAAGAAVVAV